MHLTVGLVISSISTVITLGEQSPLISQEGSMGSRSEHGCLRSLKSVCGLETDAWPKCAKRVLAPALVRQPGVAGVVLVPHDAEYHQR